jgi:ubiquinone biosynthesis protein
VSSLQRLREIVGVAQAHGFAPALRNLPLARHWVSADKNALHNQPAAERFTSMLEALGPTFVKLGQILSTRGDLLPPDFVKSLSRLQDQVPPFAFADVEKTLLQTWNVASLTDVVTSIEETALASASMAQVHRAVLKDGSDVVIKVRRPGVVEQVHADGQVLTLLAELLEQTVEEAGQVHARDFVLEFQEALSQELDFTRELRNLHAFRDANANRSVVHVPQPFPQWSGSDVLVMERIRGRRITDAAAIVGSDKVTALIEQLVVVAFEHIFVDGMFHGDPHPGNLLVTDDGKLAFIDFGLVGRLSRELQDRLLMLLLALALKDGDTLARIAIRIGDVDGRVELAPFRSQVNRLLDRYIGMSVGDVSTSNVLSDLIELSQRFGIRLPRELAILAKASASIEGIVRTLHPRFVPQGVITERAEKLLRERVDPRNLQGGGLRTALQLGLVLQELPLQIGQTLMDLERGQVQVVVKSQDLQGLQLSLRGAAMTVFGGLLAAALVVSGMQLVVHLIDTKQLAQTHGLVLVSLSFVGAGGLTGIAFGWYVTGGRVPKLKITRWLQKKLLGFKKQP